MFRQIRSKARPLTSGPVASRGRLVRTTAAAAVFGLTLLGASACGERLADAGKNDSGASDTKADSKLAAMVPDAVKDKGTINVAAAVYAPAVMQNGSNVTGWDIELTREAAALLGLKVKYTIIPFDAVIPGLQAGRYDAATGEINVTDERTQVVTFVTNHVSKDAMVLPASSKLSSFPDEASVCGLTIGAALGSSEAATAQDLAKKCTASGGKATTVKTFATQAQVNLALSQGRLDADLASGSQAAYTVDQTKGQFKLAKLGFGPEIFTGLALARNSDSAALAKAFQAANDKLIEDGSAQKVFDDLNGGLGAIDKSEIIPAP